MLAGTTRERRQFDLLITEEPVFVELDSDLSSESVIQPLRPSCLLRRLRAPQQRAIEVCVLQLRAIEARAFQLRAIGAHALEVGTVQVHHRWRLTQPFMPAAEDGNCGLDVRGTYLQGRGLGDWFLWWPLLVSCGRVRARCGAGVGGEDLGDRGAVGRRVLGDAFERVQPSQPYRERLLIVELVDCLGVAIGDLTFA